MARGLIRVFSVALLVLTIMIGMLPQTSAFCLLLISIIGSFSLVLFRVVTNSKRNWGLMHLHNKTWTILYTLDSYCI